MSALREGLHAEVPDVVYHRDPCVEPSLSSSIARLLIARSPLHAWHAHPRLNPGYQESERKRERIMEIGTVAHTMTLGAGRRVDVIDALDYKTAAARQQRADAYAAGHTPILKCDLEQVIPLVEAGVRQLAATDMAGIFAEGDAELTAIWQDGPTWCRSRIDYLPRSVRAGGHVVVPDYKTTSGSAQPDDFTRTLFDQGYDMQAAFYERGLRALIPAIRSVEFVFVVQEQDPPYALSLVGLDGQAMELAHRKVDAALRVWRFCLATGVWPAYPSEIVRAEIPAWRAERTELADMALLDRLYKWQAPHGMKGTTA